MDEDAAAELEKVFRREGITLYTGTRLLDAGVPGRGKKSPLSTRGNLSGSRPKKSSSAWAGRISLARAGKRRGPGRVRRIATNPQMQTSAPHIYAAGDCTGLHEIVHIAIQQGEVAAHNIAHPGRTQADGLSPAHRSHLHRAADRRGRVDREAGARAEHSLCCGELPVQRPWQVAHHGSQGRFREAAGRPSTGEILGGGCVGPVGGELIHEIIAADAQAHDRPRAGGHAALPSHPGRDLDLPGGRVGGKCG